MDMDILFINDNEPSTNIGCRATAHGFRRQIYKKGHNICGNIYIDELRNDPMPKNISKSDLISIVLSRLNSIETDVLKSHFNNHISAYNYVSNFDNMIPRSLNECRLFSNMLEKYCVGERIQSQMAKSDLVLINGEGAFFKNKPHARMMLFYAYLAKKYDKQCIVSNLTLSLKNTFIDSELKSMCMSILPLVDRVIFREPKSFTEYRSKVSNNCLLSSDIAFTRTNKSKNTLSNVIRNLDTWEDRTLANIENEPFVCVGGNSLFGASDMPNPPIDEYIDLVKELNKHCSVILLPSKETDEYYLRNVVKETSAYMISVKNPPELIRVLLSDASVYIGGRYHPAVFALSEGTPVIGLSTKQNKMKGLLTHANLDSDTYDTYDFASYANEIVEQTLVYITKGAPTNLNTRAKELQQLASKNVPPFE